MDLLQPGDELSRAISTANFLMLSVDGARELRDLITRSLDQRDAGMADAARKSYNKHGVETPIMAAQFNVDNLQVVIYDTDTDPQVVVNHVASRAVSDAMYIMAGLRGGGHAPSGVSLN